ncbi:MAG: hypothetical protein ABR525_10640, partial [Candidatus Limnocylindria bacterium]
MSASVTAVSISAELERICGAAHVLSREAEVDSRIADFAVDETVPVAVVTPGSAEQAAEVLRFA